jgi:hypothetical protein
MSVDTEHLVKWALRLGLSTGHADTDQDLLDEVGEQIILLRARIKELDKAYTVALQTIADLTRQAIEQ